MVDSITWLLRKNIIPKPSHGKLWAYLTPTTKMKINPTLDIRMINGSHRLVDSEESSV
jgi:hypothetical protein